MAFNKVAALTFLAFNGPALVGAQNELYRCNTNDSPRYADCDAIMASIDWTTGTLPDDPPPIEPGQCARWTADDYPRCLVQACNYRDVPQPNNVFNGPSFYSVIKSNCERDGAGGEAPIGGLTSIIVSNNPDQPPSDPPSRIKRAMPGGVVRQDITLAESKALLEKAEQVSEPNTLKQRQDPGEWTSIGITSNVKTDKRDQGAPVVSPGVSQTYETSEGFSASISSTVELGASFFEIFSASVSLTVGIEYTNTWSEALTFTPADVCESDQRGILYMYPLFDKYAGFYANDPDTVIEWLIPVNGGRVDYTFDVECLD